MRTVPHLKAVSPHLRSSNGEEELQHQPLFNAEPDGSGVNGRNVKCFRAQNHNRQHTPASHIQRVLTGAGLYVNTDHWDRDTYPGYRVAGVGSCGIFIIANDRNNGALFTMRHIDRRCRRPHRHTLWEYTRIHHLPDHRYRSLRGLHHRR